MRSSLRHSATVLLLAAILCGTAFTARATDPKLSSKLGIDSTRFSLSVDAKQKPTAGKTFQATLHIVPGPNWHVWSASMSGDGGLTPLRIKIPEQLSKYFELTEMKEVGKIMNGYDSNFETATKAHFGAYDIITTIRVKDNAPAPVPFSLYVFYQTCNETMCMPPRTFEVPMTFLGDKSIQLTIAAGTADTTTHAAVPKIETSDESLLYEGGPVRSASGCSIAEGVMLYDRSPFRRIEG